jgi:hypothetical protein
MRKSKATSDMKSTRVTSSIKTIPTRSLVEIDEYPMSNLQGFCPAENQTSMAIEAIRENIVM